MSVEKYLESLHVHDVVKLPKGGRTQGAVKFSGMPRKHPYDPEKIILIQSPLSSTTLFYEFRVSDIVHAEDLPNIVNNKGDSIRMVNIWITKGSFGIKMQPFEVDDTA